MKAAVAASAALLLAALQPQPAQAQSVRELINQVIAAQGGVEALRALKALTIKADAMHWEPGQSKVSGGEPRFLGNRTPIAWDLGNGAVRTEWDRDKKYPAIEKVTYTEVVSPALGYLVDDKGVRKPMSGIRAAAALRELERASPTLLLKMLDAIAREDIRAETALAREDGRLRPYVFAGWCCKRPDDTRPEPGSSARAALGTALSSR